MRNAGHRAKLVENPTWCIVVCREFEIDVRVLASRVQINGSDVCSIRCKNGRESQKHSRLITHRYEHGTRIHAPRLYQPAYNLPSQLASANGLSGRRVLQL